MTLPNFVTSLRALLVPFILWAILREQHMAALILFAAAAATDAIDGYLARHLHAASASGAYLDPIADKLLLSGVYLALAIIRSVPWWLVVVIFGRDLLILAASAIALLFTELRAFPPSVWGKISTFFQVLTAVAFLARNALRTPALATFAGISVWPTAALTVWSAIHYAWRGIRLLRVH